MAVFFSECYQVHALMFNICGDHDVVIYVSRRTRLASYICICMCVCVSFDASPRRSSNQNTLCFDRCPDAEIFVAFTCGYFLYDYALMFLFFDVFWSPLIFLHHFIGTMIGPMTFVRWIFEWHCDISCRARCLSFFFRVSYSRHRHSLLLVTIYFSLIWSDDWFLSLHCNSLPHHRSVDTICQFTLDAGGGRFDLPLSFSHIHTYIHTLSLSFPILLSLSLLLSPQSIGWRGGAVCESGSNTIRLTPAFPVS